MRRGLVAALLGLLSLASPTAPAAEVPAEAPAAVVGATSAAIPPVVVVLDLSGSMNDDDGTGLIKLTGAKKAVDQVIRSLPSAQPFGLWTYPSGSDSCGSGAFAIAPAPITDLNGTIARADSLIADGGTPTGPALQSAAAALTSQGATRATLVLVSDGESNCGADPCDVAKQLVSDGFDVTIHAVGFRVSEAGRGELNCVASATGGRYVDVDDSEQLDDTLQELTRARLRIQVGGTLSPLAGVPARIQVTVSNDASITASDVQVLLQLSGEAPKGLNPSLRLGNLSPGAFVQREWVLGSLDLAPGGGGADAGRPFTASAWARNADRVSVDGEVGRTSYSSLADGLGELLRAPVDAGHPIVILGDSYSAGEGAFDYATPPSGVAAGCHRSDKTYLVPELDPGDVIDLACSGAVRWDFYSPGRDGTPPQLRQLAELPEAPGAVVMTLGGNDIGFADIIRQCVVDSCDRNAEQVAVWEQWADSMRQLATVYEDVWRTINLPERRAQRDGAYAPVIVLAYPQVTHATKYGACGSVRVDGLPLKPTLGAGEVKVANDLAAHLDAALRAGVADARDAGYEVYFVAETADLALPDHTLCDGAQAYVNDVAVDGLTPRPESVHPNLLGYAAESAIIVDWSSRVAPVGPDTGANGPRATEVDLRDPPRGIFGIGSQSSVQFHLDAGKSPKLDDSLLLGGQVEVSGSGYRPGTPVLVGLHSTPLLLGTLVADERGEVHGVLRVPDSVEPGRHELVASGTGEDGAYREDRVGVSVLIPPPPWLPLAEAGAALLLLAAIAFAVLGWRARRASASSRAAGRRRRAGSS